MKLDEENTERLKLERLHHYAGAQLHSFVQFDGFYGVGEGDYVMETDDEGDWVCAIATWELRNSLSDLGVRVFVHSDTDRATAIRLTKKILELMESPTCWPRRRLERELRRKAKEWGSSIEEVLVGYVALVRKKFAKFDRYVAAKPTSTDGDIL